MDPGIYKIFEEILLKANKKGAVLEIGAIPSEKSLLASKIFDDTPKKIGLNLAPPSEFQDFKILQGNSNNMDMFEDESFDVILSNATLEHDRFFWESIKEMKRVLKPGGLMVIGIPSFVKLEDKDLLSESISEGTVCYMVHNDPGDYYRFSEQAVKEVFFDGFRDINMQTVMIPPRTITYGFKI